MSVASGPNRGRLNGIRPKPMDHGTPWAYEFFLNAGPTDQLNERHYEGQMTQVWQNVIQHPDYDDFWKSINVARSLGNVTIPVLNVAGWFDSPDPYGAIATYQTIEEKNREKPQHACRWPLAAWRLACG